jgi:hypothetical protein
MSQSVILPASMLRILHLSDIHFGQERSGDHTFLDDVREQLINDVAGLLGSSNRLDLILVNGDIAFSGKKQEYDRAVSWFDQLINVGRCDVNAILTIPGNHDIDVDLISLSAKQMHVQLRNSSPETAKHFLNDLTYERDEVNSIFPKLRTYLDFARGYNSEFEKRDIPRWIRCRAIKPGYYLRIIGMCTVQVCDLNDRLGALILGEKQYIFPEDRSVVTIVMMHHPLPWLLDKVDARSYIVNRSSVLLTGHEHLPDLNRVIPLSGDERIEISAGSTTDTKPEAPFEFAYNLLELDIQDTGLLSLTVWPRVWKISKPSFGADVDMTGGPDSKTITIGCALEAPLAAIPASEHNVLSQGASMQQDNTAEFGRLKHFFWHYLTWDQRIAVLVRAGVMSTSVENRIPQTLELDALLRAKEAGKLEIIWDDIMSFLSTEKKIPNPFKREGK